MRIDRPFDQLKEISRKSNNESKELFKYVFEKSDNLSLWIIGLSIGGISIFANNIADIQQTISSCFLRPILMLLAISVTSGIIYRSLYLYFFVILSNIIRGIDIAFSNIKTMDTESKLKGNETFNSLVEIVKNGTGDDFSYFILDYQKADESLQRKLYQCVVDHYLKSVEFAKVDTVLAIDHISETYSNFLGTSKEKFLNNLRNPKIFRRQYKWILYLTTVFYLIYILTFISALFLFVFSS